MKKALIISITTLYFFSILNCKAQDNQNPYWEFNETTHFQPQLDKGAFYKLSGFDFGMLIYDSMNEYVGNRKNDIERAKSFSYAQKTLWYWLLMDSHVKGGGFSEMYENGFGQSVPTIIKGLEHIGDQEMADLIKKAADINRKRVKWKAEWEKNKNLVMEPGVDFNMGKLDYQYYEMADHTMAKIEAYIRQHPNEIGVDDEGKAFDVTFTGPCQTFYPDQKVKHEFELLDGVVVGIFKTYFENGQLKEAILFEDGKETEERMEYFESGQLQSKIARDSLNEFMLFETFYENGVQERLSAKRIADNKYFGNLKKWYDNGQLEEASYFTDDKRENKKLLQFWEDGSKKLQATYINEQFRFQNYWTEAGEQTLKDGTGIYIMESVGTIGKTRNENSYKNYIQDGPQKSIINGILRSYREMKNGKDHGVTHDFYKNGNLKKEYVYESGQLISSKNFRKFKNPKVQTFVNSRLCKSCYELEDYEDYQLPDNEPMPINDIDVAEKFKADVAIFERYGDDYKLSYGYYLFVDTEGSVTDIKQEYVKNNFLKEQLKSSMPTLRFEPALKDGKPIESIHYVKYELILAE